MTNLERDIEEDRIARERLGAEANVPDRQVYRSIEHKPVSAVVEAMAHGRKFLETRAFATLRLQHLNRGVHD